MKGISKSFFIGSIILLLIMGGVTGYKLLQLNKIPAKQQRAGYPVEIVKVNLGTVSDTLNYVGTVEPKQEVNLAAKISARIMNISGEEGNSLKKGQVAVNLDNEELHSKINTLEKKIQAAKTGVDYWESQVEIYEKLFEEGAMPEQEYRKIIFNRDNTVSSYEEAKAALAEAKTALGNSTIIAPIDGIITTLHNNPGDLAVPGKPILTMADMTEFKVAVKVVEQDLIKLKEGGPVQLSLGDRKEKYDAKIAEIFPSLEKNIRTGTLKIVVPKEVIKKHNIKPGMSINATFLLGEKKDVIIIPKKTIQSDQEGESFVYVVKEGKAVKRLIKTGFSNNEFVEVTDGLQKGEKVVSSGLVEVYDGRPLYLTGERG